MVKRILFLFCSLSLLIWSFYHEETKSPAEEIGLLSAQRMELESTFSENIISDSKAYIRLNFNENHIYFERDRYNLNQAAKEKLGPLIDILDPRNRVIISGHTCDLGKEDYNLILSERRAEAVMNFIKYKNPSIEDIEIFGFGESYPITINKSEDDRKINRRVEIKLSDSEYKKPDVGDYGGVPKTGESKKYPNGGEKSNKLNMIAKEYNGLIKLIATIGSLIGIVGTILSIIEYFRKRNE